MPHPPTLHLVCGKAASGKSTLVKELGQPADVVTLSEDAWLAALYADQMETLADYVDRSSRLKAIIGPHVIALLNAGVSVVLDFPGNTVEQRGWMRGLIETSKANHQLHYLDASDDVCKARLHARNAKGDHPFQVTDSQFDRLAAHFVAPTADEGFHIVTHLQHDTV